MPDSLLQNFHKSGIFNADEAISNDALKIITTEYSKAQNANRLMHYNQLAGLHNPWGKSAHLFNSWELLDICQSEEILSLVTSLIGPDVILWESAFYGYNALNPAHSWTRHSSFSPINPMQGLTVRIAVKELSLDYVPGSHLSELSGLNNAPPLSPLSTTIRAGSIICHDIHLAHRYSTPQNHLPCGEYVIHYMPSTSQFVRDATSPIQKQLAEKLPLVNYGKSPIWLVHGSDHSDNDFVTGFSPPTGQWTNTQW